MKNNLIKKILPYAFPVLGLLATGCGEAEYKTVGERTYNGNPVLIQERPGETKLVIYNSEGKIEKEINDCHNGSVSRSLADNVGDFVKEYNRYKFRQSGQEKEETFVNTYKPVDKNTGFKTFDINSWEDGAEEAISGATEIYNNFLKGKKDLAKN